MRALIVLAGALALAACGPMINLTAVDENGCRWTIKGQGSVEHSNFQARAITDTTGHQACLGAKKGNK